MAVGVKSTRWRYYRGGQGQVRSGLVMVRLGQVIWEWPNTLNKYQESRERLDHFVQNYSELVHNEVLVVIKGVIQMDLLVEARTANYQKVYSRLELTRKIILEWQNRWGSRRPSDIDNLGLIRSISNGLNKQQIDLVGTQTLTGYGFFTKYLKQIGKKLILLLWKRSRHGTYPLRLPSM